MINKTFQIIKHSTPIMKYSDKNSELTSEGLFGESFVIKKIEGKWVYGMLQTDNYFGWVNIDDLGLMPKITHKIKVIRSLVLSEPHVKSSFKFYLPLGALISATSCDDNWLQINYNHKKLDKKGFVLKNNTLEIQSKHKDWVSIAEQLIGVPYKWGGRDSIGIDCSALLQICISMANIKLPRDTKDQLKFKSDEINTLQNIRRGHLIFWPGHVAIVQNSENLLHANAHYMKVNTEKIEQAIARIEKQYGKFIKIKDIK